MRKTLNASIDDQNEKLIENNDAPMVMTLKEQVAELKRQLTICKVTLGNGMLGHRSTNEKRGRAAIETWKEFQKEFKKQFYPHELMLQISDLSEKQAFLWFEVGLKPWVKQELRRQGIIEITIAMTEVESFIELGLKKDKFKSSKPKEIDNGGRNHEEDGNENGGNVKNCGNGKPPNGKWKPNNKIKGPVKCFLCNGSHMVRDYPKKYMFYAIKKDDVLDNVTLRLGSVVYSVEANRVKENEKKPVKCFLCSGSHKM
ncbi:hypothetical protein Gotur_002517 [Gossypium turneri]